MAPSSPASAAVVVIWVVWACVAGPELGLGFASATPKVPVGASGPPPPLLNCSFVNTSTHPQIVITNDCGASAKVRTCSVSHAQCVGYPGAHSYNDCPQRIAAGSVVDLLLDARRAYIVIDCPNWWGPGIDNWWTVEPKGGVWPAAYTIPKPKKQEQERAQEPEQGQGRERPGTKRPTGA